MHATLTTTDAPLPFQFLLNSSVGYDSYTDFVVPLHSVMVLEVNLRARDVDDPHH